MKRILKIFLLLVLLFATVCGTILLNNLGSKERVGYLEIGTKNESTGLYGVRISYYDKVFRNSDIYKVHIKTDSLPDELNNIKWHSDGNPFGDVYSDNELAEGTRIEDVYYTLKVRRSINGILVIIIFITLVLIIFNKQASIYYTEYKSIGLSKFIIKYYDKIFIIAIIFFAAIARLSFIEFKTGDYNVYLKSWYMHFVENGIFGFKDIYTATNANYPPIYLLIMSIMSYLPSTSEFFILLWIKLPQIIVDFVLAYYVYKIILEYSGKKEIAILSYAVTLFSPLVLFNASMMAQCDVIYSTFAIISAYYLYKEKYFKSFLLLGFSIAFKTMGIFVLPIFIIITIKKNIKLKYYILLLIPHLAATIIAVVFGSSFKTAFNQLSNRGAVINMNAANLSALLVDFTFYYYLIILAMVFCAIYLYLFLNKKKELTLDNFILWSLVISFTMPFILPGMHERFFFIAEALAIIYAFMKPKYLYITIAMHIASISTYLSFITGNPIFQLKYSALLMLVVFCLLLRTLYIENFKNESNIEKL